MIISSRIPFCAAQYPFSPGVRVHYFHFPAHYTVKIINLWLYIHWRGAVIFTLLKLQEPILLVYILPAAAFANSNKTPWISFISLRECIDMFRWQGNAWDMCAVTSLSLSPSCALKPCNFTLLSAHEILNKLFAPHFPYLIIVINLQIHDIIHCRSWKPWNFVWYFNLAVYIHLFWVMQAKMDIEIIICVPFLYKNWYFVGVIGFIVPPWVIFHAKLVHTVMATIFYNNLLARIMKT